MSYEIIYDKKFISTSRGYIPMILCGPNNVTECKLTSNGRSIEVRVRSWCHYNSDILEATEPEILAWAEKHFSENPEYEAFKQNGAWVYRRQMQNWFRSGCRKAQTLESLLTANRGESLRAHVFYYPDPDSCAQEQLLATSLCTTETLEKWLDEARDKVKELAGNGITAYIHLSFWSDKPLVYASQAKGSVVVKNKNSFLCKYEYNKSLSFTPNFEDAVVFESEESARAAIGNTWRDVKFVSYDAQKKKADTPKAYVLQFGAGRLRGSFLKKRTRTRIYGTWSQDNARGFTSVKDALRQVEEIRKSGYTEEMCGKFSLINKLTGATEILNA